MINKDFSVCFFDIFSSPLLTCDPISDVSQKVFKFSKNNVNKLSIAISTIVETTIIDNYLDGYAISVRQ